MAYLTKKLQKYEGLHQQMQTDFRLLFHPSEKYLPVAWISWQRTVYHRNRAEKGPDRNPDNQNRVPPFYSFVANQRSEDWKLTKCNAWLSVRSRWPGIGQVPVFLRVYGPRRSRGPNELAKKERGQYSAILIVQAWSMKDLLYGFAQNFSCGTQRVFPSRKDSSTLPA